ncbi:Tensin-2 [Trichinella spiralis]|uniref:Tensin-2 n=1 Tax=Trichinella spiralis TaxID=6334 RepID=A0ABR3L088_TRISP
MVVEKFELQSAVSFSLTSAWCRASKQASKQFTKNEHPHNYYHRRVVVCWSIYSNFNNHRSASIIHCNSGAVWIRRLHRATVRNKKKEEEEEEIDH